MTNKAKTVEDYAANKVQALEAEVERMREGMDVLSIELNAVASTVNAFSLQYNNPDSILTEPECQMALFAIKNHIIRIATDMEDYANGKPVNK